jgi:hypothetical protein
MHRMKRENGYFAIKVDLAKAYEKISWEFIWRVLVEIKLPEVIINVIMHAVSSVWTNVKWNGARADYFKPHRGMRQGDPISPYFLRYVWISCLILFYMLWKKVNGKELKQEEMDQLSLISCSRMIFFFLEKRMKDICNM